jgi:hypothetical protein
MKTMGEPFQRGDPAARASEVLGKLGSGRGARSRGSASGAREVSDAWALRIGAARASRGSARESRGMVRSDLMSGW